MKNAVTRGSARHGKRDAYRNSGRKHYMEEKEEEIEDREKEREGKPEENLKKEEQNG